MLFQCTMYIVHTVWTKKICITRKPRYSFLAMFIDTVMHMYSYMLKFIVDLDNIAYMIFKLYKYTKMDI